MKESRFDMKEIYQDRIDIIARGTERVLESMGLNITVKSNKFTSEKGDARIEYIFNWDNGED